MQQVLQRKLEEEVDGVLGRARYERRQEVNGVPGYRNGFGKPRRLSLSSRLYKEPVVEDRLRRGFLPLACRFTSAARSETANKSVLWKESLPASRAAPPGLTGPPPGEAQPSLSHRSRGPRPETAGPGRRRRRRPIASTWRAEGAGRPEPSSRPTRRRRSRPVGQPAPEGNDSGGQHRRPACRRR